MKKRILIIAFALLAAVSLIFIACDSADTTENTTPADTTVTTEAPTEETTSEETTAEDTSAESSEETTEAPTEEITTEEETTEAVTEPETLSVELDQTTISSSLAVFENHFTTADKDTPVDDLVDIFGDPAIEDGVEIPLIYQGALCLGEIATSAAGGTVADYETTRKRAMLTSADTKGLLSPADEIIVASATYLLPGTSWQLTTVEIDLSGVDYNGEVYLTFDFTEGVNLYHAVTGVLFEA